MKENIRQQQEQHSSNNNKRNGTPGVTSVQRASPRCCAERHLQPSVEEQERADRGSEDGDYTRPLPSEKDRVEVLQRHLPVPKAVARRLLSVLVGERYVGGVKRRPRIHGRTVGESATRVPRNRTRLVVVVRFRGPSAGQGVFHMETDDEREESDHV